MNQLVVGTDLCRYPREAGADGAARPAGTLHAVPARSAVSLCGISPRYLWPAVPWSSKPGDESVCTSCELINETRPGGSAVARQPPSSSSS